MSTFAPTRTRGVEVAEAADRDNGADAMVNRYAYLDRNTAHAIISQPIGELRFPHLPVHQAGGGSVMNRKDTEEGNSRTAAFVFILGMHRSGTSCLAGSLERCGLYLGNVGRSSRNNAKGNHEIKRVRRLNEQILRTSGGRWLQPPPSIVVGWRRKLAIRTIVIGLSRHKPCGLKDPRLLLLLETWLSAIRSYTLVGTFRHPTAVASSLARRRPMSVEHANQLWLYYNRKLIQWHQRYRFPIIEFDLTDVDAYRRTVADLASALGLTPNMAPLREFVTAELDHHTQADVPVPGVCQEAYAYLKHHSFAVSIQ